eukprot:g97.t1
MHGIQSVSDGLKKEARAAAEAFNALATMGGLRPLFQLSREAFDALAAMGGRDPLSQLSRERHGLAAWCIYFVRAFTRVRVLRSLGNPEGFPSEVRAEIFHSLYLRGRLRGSTGRGLPGPAGLRASVQLPGSVGESRAKRERG